MKILVENNSLYIDDNTAGSVEDALVNFPTLSTELWVALNTQVQELTTANAALLSEKSLLQTELDGLKAVDLQANNIIEVQMWQAREQLHTAGYLDTIDSVVNAMGFTVQNRWQFVPTLREDNALVNAVLDQIGLSVDQKHQLFVEAKALS